MSILYDIALATTYVPLVSGLPSQIKGNSTGNLSAYLNTLIKFGIGLAGILAVIMIVYGGFQYVTTDAWSEKHEGKQRIQAAVGGLLLALCSFLILNTIDPHLTDLNFAPKIAPIKDLQHNGAQIVETDAATGGVAINGIPAVQGPGGTGATGSGQDAINAALLNYTQYKGQAPNQNYIGVTDYSQPDTANRFYIVDTHTGQVVLSTQVANGYGSDPNHTGYATQFSDTNGSGSSELGAFVAKPYVSPSSGKSVLLMNGLQSGNKNSSERGVEIHPADYVNTNGQSCGRSGGCVAYSSAPGMQDKINGYLSNAFIYNYHP